jgi:UDP-N-acetylmuramyl pentapeptide phosphotransferase/UDP-N-acetylglucosamine-1-phosphate transferase
MIALPIIAFLVCGTLHYASLRIFPPLGLLDFPERYGLKRSRLPYPTGILSVCTFLFFFIYLESWNQEFFGIVTAVILLAAVNFIDDRRPLPFSIRLFVQLLAALLIFLMGTRIFTITNPLEGISGIPYIALDTWVIPSVTFSNPSVIGMLFTMLWLGLTMNALNWFDGIRGQVSVVSLIGFLTIGALSISDRVGDEHLALLAFTLAGIAAAGLFFDFPPAKVLMGDTGAMFFGLMLGVLTIYSGGKVATGFLVLGVPLLDSIIVGLRRILKGTSPFRGNATDEHLHHRLLTAGWSERQVIALTAVLGTSFGVAALFMDTLQKFLAGVALAGIMMLLSVYSGRRA